MKNMLNYLLRFVEFLAHNVVIYVVNKFRDRKNRNKHPEEDK